MEEKRCYGCMKIKSGESVCEHCGYDEEVKNEAHQLPAGTILKEQYLIGRVLGQGGFGITYLGWDMYLDIPVAIKEYFPNRTVMRDVAVSTEVVSYSGDAGARFRNNKERFMREAKMLARFSQVPEIVQVRNFFLANNTAYIVMEYVEGINLKQVVKNNGGTLSYERTIEIVKPIIEALCKVHKAGLVHRDISPDNIMLLPNGTAKLLDFGAVRDVGEADVNTPLTQSTEAILKQGYAPIEQYQNRGSLGPWTDVYALCATIYYCLTGNVPTDAPGRLLDDEDVSFEGLGLEEKVVNALQRGMALRAADRISSMDELLELLTNVQTSIEILEEPEIRFQSSKSEESTITKEEKSSNLKKLLIAAAVTVAVGVTIIAGSSFVNEKNDISSEEYEEESESVIEESAEESTEEGTEESAPIYEDKEIYHGVCGKSAWYNFDPESSTLIISGTGDMYDYNGTWMDDVDDAFPDPNRELHPWLEFREEIWTVEIQDGITRIGENAFENVHNLTDVRFGKDIKSIGYQAFLSTNLAEAVLPEGLEEIDGWAFNFCMNLKKVYLPNSLKYMEKGNFSECTSLSAVIIGDDTHVVEDAFFCERHEDQYCLRNLVLYVTPGSTAEKSAKEWGYTCREKAAGQCGENVHWYIDLDEKCLYLIGYGPTGVFNIGDGPKDPWTFAASLEWITSDRPSWFSLYSNKIEKIVAGDYITALNHRLFNNLMYLKEVDFGGASYICCLFDGCNALEEIIVPETVTYVDWQCFADCTNLRKVTFLGEETVISREVFRQCLNLKEVYFSRGAVIDDSYGDLYGISDGETSYPDAIFYVYEGSDAERYAKKYDVPYEYR